MKRVLAAVLGLLCIAPAVQAQIDRASLAGTVKDSAGGVLPGATVTVTNIATNVAAKATTSSSGTFLVVNLQSGQYLVEAEAQGLQKAVQSVILEIGQRGRVDISLSVGSMSETVTVEGVRRLLNTEDATLGSVIDQNAVANLPLAIRNWDDLLALVPGVQGDRFTEQGGGTSFGRTGGVNVHGSRSLQNNFLLDGVDNNSVSTNVQELTSQVSRPSVDSIQEFKVVTSPYSAEYGRSPGAAISVSTKSGTNEFHGTVYDFYRNEKMDANDFFSKYVEGREVGVDRSCQRCAVDLLGGAIGRVQHGEIPARQQRCRICDATCPSTELHAVGRSAQHRRPDTLGRRHQRPSQLSGVDTLAECAAKWQAEVAEAPGFTAIDVFPDTARKDHGVDAV